MDRFHAKCWFAILAMFLLVLTQITCFWEHTQTTRKTKKTKTVVITLTV